MNFELFPAIGRRPWGMRRISSETILFGTLDQCVAFAEGQPFRVVPNVKDDEPRKKWIVQFTATPDEFQSDSAPGD